MRQFLALLILCLFMTVPAVSEEFVPPAFRVLQVKTSVDFNEATFRDFVTWMRDHVGWNVLVRWDKLESEGVRADTVVNVRFDEAPVSVIVNEVFRQVSSGVTYHLTEHAMTVSSRADFNEDLFVRAYDLTDLVLQMIPCDDPPATELKPSVQTFSPFGDVAAPSVDVVADLKAKIGEIIKGIEPSTWTDAGGKGTIYWFGNTLIVRNVIEVHELIGGSFHLNS